MVHTLLVRGMLVGFLAGLLVFSFAKIFGEPQVDRAIAFETAMDEAKAKADLAKGIHDPEEPELVSRPMQASWGLLTGVMVYCTAFGGLFALAFAFAYGRVSSLSPRAVSALLALTGFISLYVVPNLKYPANPPSVGNPETIGIRTGLYFAMMGLSVLAMIGAAMLRKRLAPQHGAWSAAIIAAIAYIVTVIIVAALLPPINEVPADFPAVVLWHFRIDSLAMQAIMWATLGLTFGALTERDTIGRQHRFSGGGAKVAWR
ncbi:MAG: CbtA family protein [Pseudomonadota bacterium]